MKALHKFVRAGTRGCNSMAIIATGLLMLALMAVVVMQVFYRYVLELPLVWSDEAARHLLVWLSFVGGGVAIARNLHPRIELVDSIQSDKVRRAIAIFISSIAVAFLVLLFFISLEVAIIYNGYRSLGLGLPQSIPRLALPVGACLMAVNILARMIDEVPVNKTTQQGNYS